MCVFIGTPIFTTARETLFCCFTSCVLLCVMKFVKLNALLFSSVIMVFGGRVFFMFVAIKFTMALVLKLLTSVTPPLTMSKYSSKIIELISLSCGFSIVTSLSTASFVKDMRLSSYLCPPKLSYWVLSSCVGYDHIKCCTF